MAEQRQKIHHILLSTDGKNTALELFDAREWSKQSSNDGEVRIRINGKWHSPMGKYTFLTMDAVGGLVATLLNGVTPPEEETPPPFTVGQSVRVYFGECEQSIPLRSERGFVAAPPYMGIDGRWYVAVSIFGGTHAHLCHDVEA